MTAAPSTQPPKPPYIRANPATRKVIPVRELVSDALLLAGAGATGYGLWQFDPRFVWLFAGTLAIVYGATLGRGR